jgi:hypothetical protein
MHVTSNRRAVFGAVLTIAFASCLPALALAQSTWDRYQPGTLSDVVRDADSSIRSAKREVDSAMRAKRNVDPATIASMDEKPSEHFLATQYPTLAALVYTGQSRPIDPIPRSLISAWGRSFMRDSTMADDFHREYLFTEGKTLFWLPVQDKVASFFPKELHPGQQVNLYVMLLAGYYEARQITWGFIVNEFNASPIARARTF